MKDRINSLAVVLTAAVSMAVGAGLEYSVNKERIQFFDRYPLYLEIQDYMKDSEAGLPESPDDKAVLSSYFALYDDKYTYVSDISSGVTKNLSLVNGAPGPCGMGITLDYSEEIGYYISELTEGGEASMKGLQAGDAIYSINGNLIEPEDKSIRELAGKEGETINVEVIRDGEHINASLSVVFDEEEANGVDAIKYGDTLYLGFDHIYDLTLTQVNKELEENKYDSLIIDLRKNKGGQTKAAVDFCDQFIDEGKVVIDLKNDEDVVYEATKGKAYDVPVVVLTSAETASAAEIVTSLLKQYGNAQIVGEKTFGKGTAQYDTTFKGYAIRYTAGVYTVGSWPNWQGVGIAPDIEVEMDPSLIGTDEDVQLQKALELLG